MNLYSHGSIAVRSLTVDDAGLLLKWLSDKDVLEYYGGRDQPYNFEKVEKHFYERARDITQCIIEFEGHAIGYIQFYLISEEERQEYGYGDFNGNIHGMDQFIGEVEYWNKGIGTDLVKSMVNYLLTHEKAEKIVMDPQAWNERALRVYEKCGFVKKKYLKEHEWHEGQYRDCWIIEYEGKHNK
ncbi:N-acetyltransferase [Paenibacillus albiflavus]|uniref:N-acetyltransferase n=1 Tax=Paenibacillus albiflavus TaxID=2545760 RepID=A0A4V2WPP6_9BACL|nr:GNAT family N-acetyltransferase [Paenibacillus albiflavus]TCZ80212.1 N-acetyltransferase [Paenibacillus albiflavus]